MAFTITITIIIGLIILVTLYRLTITVVLGLVFDSLDSLDNQVFSRPRGHGLTGLHNPYNPAKMSSVQRPLSQKGSAVGLSMASSTVGTRRRKLGG